MMCRPRSAILGAVPGAGPVLQVEEGGSVRAALGAGELARRAVDAGRGVPGGSRSNAGGELEGRAGAVGGGAGGGARDGECERGRGGWGAGWAAGVVQGSQTRHEARMRRQGGHRGDAWTQWNPSARCRHAGGGAGAVLLTCWAES